MLCVDACHCFLYNNVYHNLGFIKRTEHQNALSSTKDPTELTNTTEPVALSLKILHKPTSTTHIHQFQLNPFPEQNKTID